MAIDASWTPESSGLWTQGHSAPELSELIGLPEWFADLNAEQLQEVLKNHWLAVLSVTHGNEPFWDKIVQPRQKGTGGNGLLPIRANPQAGDLGLRYVDENLMFCYGSNGDPAIHEILVAQALEFVLSNMDPDLERPEHTVLDGHNNTAGLEYFGIGQTAPPEAYAIARILELENGIVEDFSFFKSIARSLTAEIPIDSPDLTSKHDHQKIEKYNTALDTIIDLGAAGLRERFLKEGVKDMSFYKLIAELCLLNPDGTPNAKVIGVIEELEELSVDDKPFTKVPLTYGLAESLGLDPKVQYYRTFWSENESEHVPDDLPGLPHNGGERKYKRSLGVLVAKIDPPALRGDGLVHASTD